MARMYQTDQLQHYLQHQGICTYSGRSTMLELKAKRQQECFLQQKEVKSNTSSQDERLFGKQ